MPSQIKVDEIKNVAGQYKIKTNVFEGQTTAGVINVTGEGGSTTTNLQQGLAKQWMQFETTSSNSVRDSLGTTGITDNGTGDYDINFSIAFANTDFSCQISGYPHATWNQIAQLSHEGNFTTSKIEVFSAGTSGTKNDTRLFTTTVHGDLA